MWQDGKKLKNRPSCSHLELRVDHERPLDRVGQDGGVLRRHVVGRQALVVPLRNLGSIR
jgi:hypothetical protein